MRVLFDRPAPGSLLPPNTISVNSAFRPELAVCVTATAAFVESKAMTRQMLDRSCVGTERAGPAHPAG